MTKTITKTCKNGTTITLHRSWDRIYTLEVIDRYGDESDKYDFHFNNERDAVSEFKKAIRDNK